MIIPRNNRNIGKHVFGIGNIRASFLTAAGVF